MQGATYRWAQLLQGRLLAVLCGECRDPPRSVSAQVLRRAEGPDGVSDVSDVCAKTSIGAPRKRPDHTAAAPDSGGKKAKRVTGKSPGIRAGSARAKPAAVAAASARAQAKAETPVQARVPLGSARTCYELVRSADIIQLTMDAGCRYARRLAAAAPATVEELMRGLEVYTGFLHSLPKGCGLSGAHTLPHLLRKWMCVNLQGDLRGSAGWTSMKFGGLAAIGADVHAACESLQDWSVSDVERLLGTPAELLAMYACLMRDPLAKLPGAFHYCADPDNMPILRRASRGYREQHGVNPCPMVLLATLVQSG